MNVELRNIRSWTLLLLFWMGEKARPPLPYQFFPSTSTNVGVSPKNFMTVSCFNPTLSHWYKVSRPCLVPIPSYWTWTKRTPEKLGFFMKSLWYNFSHGNARVNKLVAWLHLQYDWSHVMKFCWWYHGQNYDIITLRLKKVKTIRNYVLKCNLSVISWYKLVISSENIC